MALWKFNIYTLFRPTHPFFGTPRLGPYQNSGLAIWGPQKNPFFATVKNPFFYFATRIPWYTDKYSNMSAYRNTRTSHNNCCAKLNPCFYTNLPYCLNNCRACRSPRKRSRFARRELRAHAPDPRPSNYFVSSRWLWRSPSLLCKPLILSCVYAVIVVILLSLL